MRSLRLLLVIHLVACTLDVAGHTDDDDQEEDDDDENGPVPPPPDSACAEVPDAGPSGSWRHTSSTLVAHLGDPHHRGIDLVAAADDAVQTLGGRLTYGPTDKDLEDEDVDVFACANGTWENLGRATTDDNGQYSIDSAGFIAPNGEPIYSILEGDLSCADQYNFLLPPGTKVVVSDIDGTLTTDDAELIMQVADESYVPKMMTGGDAMLQAWDAKGYPIIYLTARSHQFRSESRVWLRDFDFPAGPMITSNMTNEADVYKTAWLKRMFGAFGWVPVAAYGNADTDIIAYENAGIPKDKTFIVGPLAGNSGTVAIPNMDYTQHTASFVAAQPNNQ